VSDIDTAVVDSLKVLDLKWPIREADIEFYGAVEHDKIHALILWISLHCISARPMATGAIRCLLSSATYGMTRV
jgi:hypothetical protein